MKNLALLLLASGIASVMAQNWKLVWSDEFNGSTLDGSKWNIENHAGNTNNELEYYTNRAQNVHVSNGNLAITALKEEYGGRHYTSGRINTDGKFSILYGKFEMRAKLPYGQGIWPAFWMLGNNIHQVGWPTCGEIDIMETIGKDPSHNHGTLHAKNFDKGASYYLKEGFSSDYHTFAANW